MIDPENSKNMLACWNNGANADAFKGEPTSYSVVNQSSDGGKTWRKTLEFTANNCDASCVFGPGGVAYATALRSPIYKSSDAGKTWTKTIQMGVPFDRPYLTVDNTQSKFRGNVYFHYLSFASRMVERGQAFFGVHLWQSTDQANSFFGPAAIASQTVSPGNATVLSDGTFVAVGGERGDPVANSRIVAMRLEPVADRSKFSNSVAVSTWDRSAEALSNSTCSIFPKIKNSILPGAFQDRLYVAWPDNRRGKSDIVLSHSTDKGKTWSQPVSVKGEALRQNGGNSCSSEIAINKDGILGVIWWERHDLSPPDKNGNVWDVNHDTWFTASLDGGETFLPAVKLSEEVKPLFFRIGDNIGLDVDRDGRFHAVWIENRTGFPQVYYAPITVTARKTQTSTVSDNKELKEKIYNEEIRPLTAQTDASPDWGSIEKQVTDTHGFVGKEVVWKAKPQYYFVAKDWNNFQKSLSRYAGKYGTSDIEATTLNNYAWAIFKKFGDKKILGEAALWSLESVRRQNNEPEAIDTYANILYRSGRTKEAIEWEEKALAQVADENGKRRFQATIDKMKKGEPTWPVTEQPKN
ncbi:MAG TPA: hypothetical protein VK612_09310 [Pyrinomonadaceae bacterium]|nr:hypothetical protein [Pyrinomonadaceae bacterium]